MSDRSKYSGLVHLGKVLDGMVTHNQSNTGNIICEVFRLWHEIVGIQIAENTRPFAMKDSILLVHVSSSVWFHQLMFLKRDLLNRLKNIFGEKEINDIKFQIAHF